jgi:hypothetical protein
MGSEQQPERPIKGLKGNQPENSKPPQNRFVECSDAGQAITCPAPGCIKNSFNAFPSWPVYR